MIHYTKDVKQKCQKKASYLRAKHERRANEEEETSSAPRRQDASRRAEGVVSKVAKYVAPSKFNTKYLKYKLLPF